MTLYKRRDAYNAFQNTGDWAKFQEWAEAVHGGPLEDEQLEGVDRRPDGTFVIASSRGAIVIQIGDWFFQSATGELLGIEESAFEKLFEPVDPSLDPTVSHDEGTLVKVGDILEEIMDTVAATNTVYAREDMISMFQNKGILFRERVGS